MESDKDIKEKIRPVMEAMVFELVCEKPENPAMFMLEWLRKHGGYTSTGLTIDEKNELERLRVEIKRYREMESHNGSTEDDNKSVKSQESDEEEEEEVIPIAEINKAKQRSSLPRTAVSAEVYGLFNKKEDFKARVISKTEIQVHRIKARILQSFLFGSLDQKELGIVIDAMEERTFKHGETVIQQGDNGDCLYVVEVGQLGCYKTTSGSDEKFLKHYGPGEAFGELALLYNAPRAATVRAQTDCTLWSLDRETFNHIVKDAAQKKREKYENFLKSVDILSTIDAYELMQISDALRTATFSKGEYVIKEGEMGDIFYIIEDGEAIATKVLEPGKPPAKVMDYKKGDYFGERALIRGEPRAANIVATSTLKLISLDRDSFKRLLGPIDSLLKRNIEKYTKFISV